MKRTNYFGIALFLFLMVLVRVDINRKYKEVRRWREVHQKLETTTGKRILQQYDTLICDTVTYKYIKYE